MNTTLDAQKVDAEIAKLLAETSKLNAEAGKFRRETFLMPFVAGAGVLGAAIAIVKTFLH